MTDREFLIWIHRRLVNVHKESELVDYMHKLRSIIRRISSEGPNIGSENSLDDLLEKIEHKSDFNWKVNMKPESMKPAIRQILGGSQGKDVLFWNKLLGTESRDFTLVTDSVTRCFQRQHDLTVDGIVGTITWQTAKTSAMYAARYKRLFDEMYGNCAPEVDTKGLDGNWSKDISGNWHFAAQSLDGDGVFGSIPIPKKSSFWFKMYQIALCASHELARRGDNVKEWQRIVGGIAVRGE
jgi:hypothetical protein